MMFVHGYSVTFLPCENPDLSKKSGFDLDFYCRYSDPTNNTENIPLIYNTIERIRDIYDDPYPVYIIDSEKEHYYTEGLIFDYFAQIVENYDPYW